MEPPQDRPRRLPKADAQGSAAQSASPPLLGEGQRRRTGGRGRQGLAECRCTVHAVSGVRVHMCVHTHSHAHSHGLLGRAALPRVPVGAAPPGPRFPPQPGDQGHPCPSRCVAWGGPGPWLTPPGAGPLPAPCAPSPTPAGPGGHCLPATTPVWPPCPGVAVWSRGRFPPRGTACPAALPPAAPRRPGRGQLPGQPPLGSCAWGLGSPAQKSP